jgi:LuxR family maltose regulon positive regulatory protein
VSRPRLTRRLEDGLPRKLTLLSAPAGFGKTTLLSESIAIRGPEACAAWVSLDASDNDPERFWSYVFSALQDALPGLGMTALELLRSSQAPPIEALLASLINEISLFPSGVRKADSMSSPGVHTCLLVLDDFHLITEPQILNGLVFLLDNLPPQLHLVVSGRADPPWPLARLRARGELTELRAPDLRFTAAEAASFLNDAMGLDLSSADIAALEARTEGWIAGLQMAAVSMRERARTQGAQSLSGFVQAFTGSHRFVLDYLMEEVLEHQPSHVRDFLLQTSILQRMNAALCNALTGETRGQDILVNLEQANLFVIPLDDQRCWYRYHHLFADLLRSRLEQAQPTDLPVLHRRASAWHEADGSIAEAVNHALLAGDYEAAADLVERNVLAFKDHGALPSVVRWLDAFPPEVVHRRPWLCVARGWTLAYVGRFDDAESLLITAEQCLGDPGSEETRHLAGHVAAIRGYKALFIPDILGAIQESRSALEMLPESDLQTRLSAATSLASALRVSGEMEAAERTLAQLVADSRASGSSDQTTVGLLNALSAVLKSLGRLNEGIAILREAIQLAERATGTNRARAVPAAGHAHIRLGDLLFDQNRVDEALYHVQLGMKLCRRWGQANAIWESYRKLAWILQSMGDANGARRAFRQAVDLGGQISPWAKRLTLAVQAELAMIQGDLDSATSWALDSGLTVNDNLELHQVDIYYVYAHVLLFQAETEPCRLQEAQHLLARLLRVVQAAGATRLEIVFLVLQAQLHQQQQDEEQALDVLERALSLAAPEGFMRAFLDAGPAIAPLLQQAAARGSSVEYVDKLLGAITEETSQYGQISGSPHPSAVETPHPPPSQQLIEQLTQREMEVLRLLATTLPTPDIASQLYISVSTVRSHVKHIYGKLGVHSRIEAVDRARELELL